MGKAKSTGGGGICVIKTVLYEPWCVVLDPARLDTFVSVTDCCLHRDRKKAHAAESDPLLLSLRVQRQIVNLQILSF